MIVYHRCDASSAISYKGTLFSKRVLSVLLIELNIHSGPIRETVFGLQVLSGNTYLHKEKAIYSSVSVLYTHVRT